MGAVLRVSIWRRLAVTLSRGDFAGVPFGALTPLILMPVFFMSAGCTTRKGWMRLGGQPLVA